MWLLRWRDLERTDRYGVLACAAIAVLAVLAVFTDSRTITRRSRWASGAYSCFSRVGLRSASQRGFSAIRVQDPETRPLRRTSCERQAMDHLVRPGHRGRCDLRGRLLPSRRRDDLALRHHDRVHRRVDPGAGVDRTQLRCCLRSRARTPPALELDGGRPAQHGVQAGRPRPSLPSDSQAKPQASSRFRRQCRKARSPCARGSRRKSSRSQSSTRSSTAASATPWILVAPLSAMGPGRGRCQPRPVISSCESPGCVSTAAATTTLVSAVTAAVALRSDGR